MDCPATHMEYLENMIDSEGNGCANSGLSYPAFK